MAQEVGVEETMPRLCNRQTRRDNHDCVDPKDYFKKTVLIPFLDHVLMEMEERQQ